VIHDESRLSACPPDATLASFYAGELAGHDEDALRDHLADCHACVERARDAAAFVDAMKDDAREVPPGRRIGRVPAWAVAMAAVFAAAAILVAWRMSTPLPPVTSPDLASAEPLPPADARERWRDLAVEAAPYVPDDGSGILWRGGDRPSDTPAEGSLAWAMEPYVAGDFAGAATRLNRRLRAGPNDDRTLVFLGVSLLLAGEPDEAVEPLRRVAEGRGTLSGDASWYLAVACLKTGDEACAVARLNDWAAQAGDRGERARRLLQEIEGSPKR
jgi:hypothetical protein